MKTQFSFQIRQAMQVAIAVAEEVQNNTRGRSFGERQEREVRPVLLSIRGTVPTFHFEGGTVVKVQMVDLDQFTESWRTPHIQNWVVTHCEVRYYRRDTHAKGEKISEVWEADKLSVLKKSRPWGLPHVQDRREIKGVVGVFINTPAGEGFLSVDPERNQEGHFTMHDVVEYARFIEKDLERAKAEALKILDGYLTVNAVAVFYNCPVGAAYCVDSPSGNYKGSGHYPFSFAGEYDYDPNDLESRNAAIQKAEADVRSLTTES